MISAIWQYLGRQLSYSVLKVIKTTKNMHFVAAFASSVCLIVFKRKTFSFNAREEETILDDCVYNLFISLKTQVECSCHKVCY
jgi:hypothetical protein